MSDEGNMVSGSLTQKEFKDFFDSLPGSERQESGLCSMITLGNILVRLGIYDSSEAVGRVIDIIGKNWQEEEAALSPLFKKYGFRGWLIDKSTGALLPDELLVERPGDLCVILNQYFNNIGLPISISVFNLEEDYDPIVDLHENFRYGRTVPFIFLQTGVFRNGRYVDETQAGHIVMISNLEFRDDDQLVGAEILDPIFGVGIYEGNEFYSLFERGGEGIRVASRSKGDSEEELRYLIEHGIRRPIFWFTKKEGSISE
jgi:hypothetical protein